MKLKYMSALLDSTVHHFWKAHAHVVSRTTPSVLPCDLLYIILRFVPSWQYLNLYGRPDPPVYNCEIVHDPWQQPDLDEPRAFGDY